MHDSYLSFYLLQYVEVGKLWRRAWWLYKVNYTCQCLKCDIIVTVCTWRDSDNHPWLSLVSFDMLPSPLVVDHLLVWTTDGWLSSLSIVSLNAVQNEPRCPTGTLLIDGTLYIQFDRSHRPCWQNPALIK